MPKPIAAPFPWFGGKSRVAAEVWDALGNPRNYVEPFAGSLAVLLARPHAPTIETVNDADGLLVNFWRAVRAHPEAVADAADWPVSELDLSARQLRLIARRQELTARLAADPEHCDPQLAGWWVWGVCAWIGNQWCQGLGPWVEQGGLLVESDAGGGITRPVPHLGNRGRGVHRVVEGDRLEWCRATFRALAKRLRDVRICCGDWARVVTPAVTTGLGDTAVFLDPPYVAGDVDYAAGDRETARAVCEWALDHGEHMRIAVCGHAGEHALPGWRVMRWKGARGYAVEANGNRARECVWLSPRCERRQGELFDGG